MENASTVVQNPLMAKLRLPGRTFQLPSRGTLYHNGELSSAEGEIHVHPLSALTEINLKNPDTLFNGKALEEVCQECIPEIKKPLDLYGRDIDALMMFIRMVTYGPIFEINVKHTCDAAKQHSYQVNLDELISRMTFLDPTMLTNFTATLQNGQVVTLLPVTFRHMIKLFQMNTGRAAGVEITPAEVKANIIFNLIGLIKSVDGVEDKALIEEWAKTITTPMTNRITKIIDKMNEWGPPPTSKITCKDCNTEVEVELPLNPISFFTE